MPSALTYPGVYIEEIPSGVRTITGVATSITAFIGRARMGPVNRATTINSFGDFERIFGGLWEQSEMSFAIRDFYLNGGSKAVIVRLFHPTFADEAERAKVEAAATLVATAAKTAGAGAATNPGAAAKTAADAKNTEIAGGTLSAVEKQAAKDVATAIGTLVNEATKEKVTEVADQSVLAVSSSGFAEFSAGAASSSNRLSLKARWPGTWANGVRVRIDYDVPGAGFGGVAKNDLFNLTVKDTSRGTIESFRNLTHLAGVRNAVTVLENESKMVLAAAAPTARPPISDPDPLTDADKIIVPFSSKDTDKRSHGKSRPGNDGQALNANDYTGSELAQSGIYSLEQLYAHAGVFNLLCIPHSFEATGAKTVASTAIAYCEKRRAMFLMDPLKEWDTKDAPLTGSNPVSGLDLSRNAAVFFPRLKQPHPLKDGQIETFAPCGAVAGIFARTDSQRGVWKAPAGLEANLIGVPELSVGLTDEENGELNPKAINCLRAFPTGGRVVWGSRTLKGDDGLADEYKYIPVRRTALFIEESLYRGTQWVVFEPNDEPLWAQIRLNVGAFMHGLFRQGAFQGQTPKDAYFVKCDKETTPQDQINLGIVNIIVGFAPLKPAEFVVIKLQQMAGQIET